MDYKQKNENDRKQMEIGARIRRKRLELDMTQVAFSHLLDISPSYLSAIERGQRGVSSRICRCIHDITGMSFDYLLSGTSPVELSYEEYVRESTEWNGKEPPKSLKHRMELLLLTCSDTELTMCYELCHAYLSGSRRLQRDSKATLKHI